MNRPSRLAVGVASAALSALLVGVAADAATPATETHVIHGCYQKNDGQLRVIDPAKQTCRASEVALDWNQQGPAAPAPPTTTTTSAPPSQTPFVHAISPAAGPCSGGQFVEIAGENLAGVTGIGFVGGQGLVEWKFTVDSDRLIRATSAPNLSQSCVEGDGLGETGDLIVGTRLQLSQPVAYTYRTATTPARPDIAAALFDRINRDRAASSSHAPAPLRRDTCLDRVAESGAHYYQQMNSPPPAPPDCSTAPNDTVFGRGSSIDAIVSSPGWNAGLVANSQFGIVGVGVWGDASGQLWAVVYFG